MPLQILNFASLTICIFLVLGIVGLFCISIQPLMLCAKQGSMWAVGVFLEAIPDIFIPSNNWTIHGNDCKPPNISCETQSQCRPTLLPPNPIPQKPMVIPMPPTWGNIIVNSFFKWYFSAFHSVCFIHQISQCLFYSSAFLEFVDTSFLLVIIYFHS